MMKRILSIFLIAVLVLNTLPVSALAAQTVSEETKPDTLLSGETAPETEVQEEETPDEGWSWSLDGTVLTISGTGPMDDYAYATVGPWGKTVTEVIIKSGITSVGNHAFYGCNALTKVTMPDSITHIGEMAFAYCSGLTEITIGEGVKTVGDEAFSYCTKLATVNFNAIACETMNNYNDDVFYGCNKLTTFLVGEKVTHIPNSIFQNCTTLTTVALGSAVTSIGDSAFSRCTGLTQITIPQSVTAIGEYAFGYCSGLSEIAIPSGITRVGTGAFAGCNFATTTYGNAKYLGNAENPYLVLQSATSTSITAIEIHPDTAVILDNAFASCKSLTAVTIPDSVHFIGHQAFYNCNKLAQVTLGTGLKAIDTYAFDDCSALTQASVPNLMAWLQIDFGDYYANPTHRTGTLYVDGELITNLVIPETVTTIYPYAFYRQAHITEVSIPQSVTQIGTYAFNSSGITSVQIPEGVTEIQPLTFAYCQALETVIFHDGITAIGASAFSDCSSLTEIALPAGLQSLGDNAFADCALLAAIQLPDGLRSFGKGVFHNCPNITQLVIPDSVTEFSEGALSGMYGLQTLTVPFAGICKPETDTTRKTYYPFGYFFGTSSYNQSVATEQTERTVYASDESAYSTSTSTYYLPKSLTEVTVTGEDIPILTFYNCAGLTKINLPNVKRIGHSAFENCTGLTKITLPNVRSIGEEAFQNCTGLVTLTVSPQLETLGTDAFSGCSSLANTVYENGKYLGDGENPYAILLGVEDATATAFQAHPDTKLIASRAFASCTALTQITIPDGVTAIGKYAFYGCTGLTSLVIPNSVKTIGKYAFQSCSGLQSVTLPAAAPEGETQFLYYFSWSLDNLPSSLTAVTVTGGEIPENAFNGCSQLKTITLREGVTAIGKQAFRGCTGLTHIGIPGSVKTIGDNAFESCSKVTEIYLSEGVESIGASAFLYCEKAARLTLPESLTKIGSYAFQGCTGLTTATLPSNLQEIGTSIFKGCTNITTMTFGKMDQWLTAYFDAATNVVPVTAVTVKSGIVPANAFNGTTKIATVTLKEGVTAIGPSAFSGCTVIKYISLPASITTIGASAFYGCTALTNISIPSSVTTIEASAFMDCTGLSYHVDGIAKYLGNTDNPKYVLAAITDTTITSFNVSEDTGIILDDVFKNFTKLTTVSIPNTVTSIGSKAFYSCTALTSVTIPEGVTAIRGYTFYGCKKLTQITIPAGITEIGQSAFMGCSGLTRVDAPDLTAWCSIDFFDHPANPVYLAGNLYVGGTLLTKLEVPASIKTLRSSAFAGCTSLKEVIVPDTVETMEGAVFAGCSSLQSMTIPFVGMQKMDANTYPHYPLGHIFGTTSYTAGTAASQPYYVGPSSTTSATYYIPNSLKSLTVTGGSVYYGAFLGCVNLTSIDVSATDGGVAGRAFYNCKALTDLKLPSNITTIGDYAFYGCLKLTEITIPDTVTQIGSYAFALCSALQKVTIPNSVTSIGSYAFSTCTGLTELTIPESVTSFGMAILAKCSGLSSLTIPFVGESRKTASDTYQYPLGYLFGSTSYTGSTLTKQYYYGSSTTSTTYSNYYIPTKLKTVTVTDGDLNYGAFYGCANITKIGLGDGVENVNTEAFTGTTSLEAIEVTEGNPNYSSLYRILYNKDQTEIIYIPTKHTYILTVQYAYLTGETAADTVVQRMKSGVAYNVAIPEILGYSTPLDSVSGTMPMQDLTVDVIYYENSKLTGGACTDTLSWTLYQDGSLIFRGTGAIPDYESAGAPWAEYADEVLRVYLDSRVTGIGAYAFENCRNMTFIDYGYGVSSVGAYAFAGCSGLTSFKMPDSVTDIAAGAFSGCTGLKSVTIPDNIAAVGSEAFRGCSGLIQVTVGGNVRSIGSDAFADCGKLTQVYFRGEPAELGSNGLGSTANKYVYYYSTVEGWDEAVTDGLWNGYTAVPYNAIAQEGFNGTNVYIIKVVDRYNTPLVGAVVELGGEIKAANADGMVYFVKPTEPQKLKVSCSNHITFEDAAFVATTTQVMDIIELSDRPSVVQGVSFNGQSIATTVGVLNCGNDETVTIAVSGYSKYTIVKYELHQGSRLIATVNTSDTACTFRVKASAFEEGETVLVRMYTADGYMVASALNIDVIKLADIADQQIIEEMSNLDLEIGLGDLGAVGLELPFEFHGVEDLYTRIEGRTIYVGINLNVNDLLERKLSKQAIQQEVQKAMKPNASASSKATVKLAGYLEIEYLGNDEYYIKSSYVKLGVSLAVEGEASASFYGIVGVYCKLAFSTTGSLEVHIARFTPEKGFELDELNYIQEVALDLELGAYLLWRAGSAGAYGKTTATITLGIVPRLEWKEVVVSGELGVRWSLLWGLASGEKVLASGEFYRWPEAQALFVRKLLSAMQDPDSYTANDRGYLENRTEWQENGDYLQKNIYDNVAPKIVKCGDTTMMLWLDDNSQRADGDFQTLYYSVYTDGSWSAPVAVADNGTFDCEFDVCVSDGKIYVVYTEMMGQQSGVETLDVADQSSIDALVSGVEVQVAVYENGSFGEATRLTDNAVCELLPTIAVVDGVPTVTWLVSNSVGLSTEEADTKLCTATLSQSGWSEPDQLISGSYAISDITTVTLQNKHHTAYVLDADGNEETAEDLALILRGEDGSQLQLDTGVITQVSAAEVAGQQAMVWCNNSKLYMLTDVAQEPVCLMPENVNSGSKFQIVPLSDQRSVLLFVAAGCDETGGKSETNLYSTYIGAEGCLTPAVKMITTQGYIAGYSACYQDDTLVAVYTETFTTVSEGTVETVSHLRSAEIEFYTDLIIDDVQYDVTQAQPNTQLELSFDLRNGGTDTIDGITVNFYDSTDALLYTADQALLLESGASAQCLVTVVLPQEIATEDYRIELLPKYNMFAQTDAQPENNSAQLALAYADIQIEAEQKIIGEKNYIIMSVANGGNAGSKVLLQVYTPDASGKLIGEVETGEIAPGATEQYIVDIHALTTAEDDMVLCLATAAFDDPFQLNNTDVVSLFHIQSDIFVKDPEQVILNPELSIVAAVFDKYTPEDIAVQITAEAESFAGIEGLTAGTDYTVSEGQIVISSQYLATLETGSHTLALVFDFGYDENVVRNFTVEVKDSTPVTVTGSVTIAGENVVGGTVTADLSQLAPGNADLTFSWAMDDQVVGTERSYTAKAEDLGKTLTLTVTGTNGYEGVFTAETVIGLYQPKAPVPPVIAKADSGSVTVTKVSGVEYSLDQETWQDDPVFTGLLPNKTYTVYARVKATDTAAAGEISQGTTVTTLKLTGQLAAAPEMESRTSDQIVLVAVPGMEYKIEGGAWTDSNVFTGLDRDTEYVFYQRYKETDTTYAGEESVATLRTAAGVAVSGTVTGFGDANGEVTILLMQGDAEIARVVTTDGTYRMTGIVSGEYSLVISKQGHATTAYAITVGSEDLTQNVIIYFHGDADGDGYVDAYDASLIKKYSVGAIAEEDLNLSALDLDGDGFVDAYDASLIQKFSVGAIDKFPCEN